MAMTGYLTLKGQKQGPINGSVILAGRKNTILVHSYSTEIDSPRDLASGLPISHRTHSPVVLLKELDQSSPLLWKALVTNEILVTWSLAFFLPNQAASPAPAEQPLYTVRLTNASISSIREFLPDGRDPATPNYSMHQQVSFTYQTIEWIWTEGTVAAQESWEASANG